MSCAHGNHVDACDLCDEVNDSYKAGLAEGLRQQAGCKKCGQTDHGQQGEYPCSECGLPMEWGQQAERVDEAMVERASVAYFGDEWPDVEEVELCRISMRHALQAALAQNKQAEPIPMVLHCPSCGLQHIDALDAPDMVSVRLDGHESRWDNPPHRSHLCHGCGSVWRPADVPTTGVVTTQTHGKADKIVQAERTGGEGEAFDFAAHLRRQREWSDKTFGPGARAQGVVDHIRKELLEIEADPGDLKEWIDVVILALDGAWRSDATPAEIIDALVAKQTKNEGRVWPDWRTADPTKAIEHDRSHDLHSPLPRVGSSCNQFALVDVPAQQSGVAVSDEAIRTLAKLAKHADDCLWATPLPTGEGCWHCTCGYDRFVLDGVPTDQAVAPLLAGGVPEAIVELAECRKYGWNDSAPAFLDGWNKCRDAMLAARPSQPTDAQDGEVEL